MPALNRSQRYGAAHRQVRAQLIAGYLPGGQACVLCGELMDDPPKMLDLAHDTAGRWLGLSHRRCNRGAAATLGNKTRTGNGPRPTADHAVVMKCDRND